MQTNQQVEFCQDAVPHPDCQRNMDIWSRTQMMACCIISQPHMWDTSGKIAYDSRTLVASHLASTRRTRAPGHMFITLAGCCLPYTYAQRGRESQESLVLSTAELSFRSDSLQQTKGWLVHTATAFRGRLSTAGVGLTSDRTSVGIPRCLWSILQLTRILVAQLGPFV
jgi:hypothetical protein